MCVVEGSVFVRVENTSYVDTATKPNMIEAHTNRTARVAPPHSVDAKPREIMI
jgi:hypothetical protein